MVLALIAHTTSVSGQYWCLPILLEIVRLFRESVTLKPAEASFRQGWKEALAGETKSVSELWEGI